MKALTICQPYPRLILIGEKHVENRTWSTPYRGPLLIHAGKSRQWLEDGDEEEAVAAGDPLVYGALVGVARLAACVRLEVIESGQLDREFPQLANRAHCGGPWCWVLDGVRRLRAPIPWRGDRGLFDVPDEAVREAL